MKFLRTMPSAANPAVLFNAISIVWGFVAPFGAYVLREGTILNLTSQGDVALYVVIAGFAAAVSLFAVTDNRASLDPFTTGSAVQAIKAALATIALTALVCFFLTRLTNVPRSVLVIHFLLLAVGSVTLRAAVSRLRQWPTAGFVSLALLCGLAFTLPLSYSISRVFLVVLMLGTLWLIITTPDLWKNPIVIASGAWIVFVVAMAIRAKLAGPPGDQIRSIGKDVLLALSPAIAIQAAFVYRSNGIGRAALSMLLLGFGCLGGLLLILRNADLMQGLAMFNHLTEGGSANSNRNFGAFIAGLMVPGMLTLLVYVAQQINPPAPWRDVVMVCATLIFLTVALALLAMQGRGSWLATTGGVVVWIGALFLSLKRRAPERLASVLIGLMPLLVSGLALVLIWLPHIQTRMSEYGGVSRTLRGGFAVLTGRSLPGIDELEPRFQLYKRALHLIGEKPLLGWGPDVSSLPGSIMVLGVPSEQTQFHNGYLQFVVSLGFVGLALFLSLSVILIREWWHSRRTASDVEPAIGAACCTSAGASLLACILLINAVESIIFVNAAALIMMIVFGLMCSRGRIEAAVAARTKVDRPDKVRRQLRR